MQDKFIVGTCGTPLSFQWWDFHCHFVYTEVVWWVWHSHSCEEVLFVLISVTIVY